MSISTDDVFNKIYGSSATGETISLSGGKRYYLDAKPMINNSRKNLINNKTDNIRINKQKRYNAKKENEEVIIYSDPNHFPDNKLKEYIDKLYLDYYTGRSSPNTIYIIPSDTTLKEIYSTIKILTKNIIKGSAEERKIIMENADKLLYKRYIFSKFGDNRKDQGYKIGPNDDIDNEYPNGNFPLLRRINIANEIYYFSYNSPEKINISVNADMKNSVELKYLGRCAHGIYIFNGDLPKEQPEIYIDKYEKHNTLYGGNITSKANEKSSGINNLKTYNNSLISFINSYNNKDNAIKSFILKRYINNPDLVKKYINSDIYYTFFGIISDDLSNNVNFDEIINTKVSNPEEIEQEIGSYSANNLIDNMSSRIKIAFNKISSRKSFNIKDIEKLYKNKDINIIRADIMTALYHNGIKDINELLSITNNINNNMSNIYNEIITDAYSNFPMTSNIGRAYCYIPNGNFSTQMNLQTKKYNNKNNSNDLSNNEDILSDESFY